MLNGSRPLVPNQRTPVNSDKRRHFSRLAAKNQARLSSLRCFLPAGMLRNHPSLENESSGFLGRRGNGG